MKALLGKTGIVKRLDPDSTVLVEYQTGESFWYRPHWLVPAGTSLSAGLGKVYDGILHGASDAAYQAQQEPEPATPRKWRMRDFRC